MSNHTQGPWSIHEWKHAESGVTYIGEDNGVKLYTGQTNPIFQIVADPKHLLNSNTFGSFEGCHIAQIDIAHDGRDEALANARIIAAGPELLESLEDLLFECVTADTFGELSDSIKGETLDKVRAVIAKAKGESQK